MTDCEIILTAVIAVFGLGMLREGWWLWSHRMKFVGMMVGTIGVVLVTFVTLEFLN